MQKTSLEVSARTWGLTAIAMLAFAANSLLCREALRHADIDPASFTWVRIVSGGLMLAALVRLRRRPAPIGGNWVSALALLGYATCFSFAYVALSAGTGALLLFGAVQTTMISRGLLRGERLRRLQWVGFALALGGLIVLLLPGLSAPKPVSAIAMLLAGVSWGIYSLRGVRESAVLAATAGNFLRAIPLAALVSAVTWAAARIDVPGLLYAVLSGALASGVGYSLWYAALRGLPTTFAATVQLSVPVITALAGALLLGEVLTLRLLAGSFAVLGGIALVVLRRR